MQRSLTPALSVKLFHLSEGGSIYHSVYFGSAGCICVLLYCKWQNFLKWRIPVTTNSMRYVEKTKSLSYQEIIPCIFNLLLLWQLEQWRDIFSLRCVSPSACKLPRMLKDLPDWRLTVWLRKSWRIVGCCLVGCEGVLWSSVRCSIVECLCLFDQGEK